MEPVFRPATAADVEVLLGFMRSFYAIDAYPFDEQIARGALERLLRDPALGRVWLIDADHRPVGYLVLTLGYSLEFHGRDAFVDELYVAEPYRHQGVGRRAVQHAIAACRELGVDALHLEVERTNVVAQSLYGALGFRDHDRYLLTRWIER